MHEDRLFVRDGRRHYRRLYSLNEVRAGLVILALLTAVALWVVWRGANPDPALFAATTLTSAASAAGRGPLPDDLAPAGWADGGVSRFGADNLYVKINGRADYYKSFGFEELFVATLTSTASEGRVVDIELFDQGGAANALGAYEGERSPGTSATMTDSGLYHFDRNALFMTRGRYYVRAIASEESEEVGTLLRELRVRLEAALPGAPLPWTYALFVGGLGLEPGAVSYKAENAFSFGFARDVHVATLADGETEVFVVAAADAAAAQELADRFHEGFSSLGRGAGEEDGAHWVEDQYIKTIAGAAADDRWVLGVRGAPGLAPARAALADLRGALEALPVEVTERALASSEAGSEGSGEEDADPVEDYEGGEL